MKEAWTKGQRLVGYEKGAKARGQVESDARKRAASKLSHIFWRSRESFSSGLSRFGVRSELLQTKNRLEINPMFQTTRFSRPMLKNGRLLTIALLALASFGAPALSAQTCCFVPNYSHYQLPSAHLRETFNINGVNYRVDNNLFVWQRNPYGPWVVVGHIVATGDGYIATMYSGGRYRAIPVRN